MPFQSVNSNKTQLRILLFGVLLSHLGTYMVLPILPIYLKIHKGLDISSIGIILAVTPFAFQAGSLSGGFLADRIGRRTVIAIGAWINALALSGYAIVNQVSLLILVALISGIGIGLNAPSTKAAISVVASSDKNKTTAFSLRGIAASIGTALAGLLTYFVLGGSSSVVFFVASGLYVVLGIITWLFLQKGCGDEDCTPVSIKEYKEIGKNHAFILFSIVMVFVWALYTQLSISLPLRAESILPDPGVVSLIWTINSILVILLQTLITRRIIDKIHPMFSIAAGSLFLGIGLGTIYFSTNFYWLILSGAIFIIGEMLFVPTMDITITRLGTAKLIGAFFGLSNFVSGLGEGAGKFLGGQLLSVGTSSAAPWLLYCLYGVIISLVLVALRYWKPLRTVLDKKEDMIKDERSKFHNFENQFTNFSDWFLGRRKRTP
ncbi:MFS transporter [Sutcliffiella deserti]|uniref:MFS transporter n=1 Tax=Sutcliffiella deserti TaxID=2875501 RepID=UPI001CBACB39|nr:MFS transporter [Sutcliffiella deserti]